MASITFDFYKTTDWLTWGVVSCSPSLNPRVVGNGGMVGNSSYKGNGGMVVIVVIKGMEEW